MLPHALEAPPVLTPRFVRSLNGRIDERLRGELLAWLDDLIARCFRPFARSTGRPIARRFDAGVQRFLPYRLAIGVWLLRLLGERVYADLLRSVGSVLDERARDRCRELGVSADAIADLLRRYEAWAAGLLTPPAVGVPESGPAAEGLEPFVRRVVWSVTRLDFALTAVFLAIEEEVRTDRRTLRYALAAAHRAMKALEGRPRRSRSKASRGTAYFRLLLQSEGLLGTEGWPSARGLAEGEFQPVTVRGEPVSRTVLRERR